MSLRIISRKTPLSYLLFSLLVIMSMVNLVGVLGPELAFDALWYHLVLPKLYLLRESIVFIPGGLLYYSAMPKLAELLYLGGLTFGGEVFPKFFQFLFCLFTLVLIYKASRMFVSKKLSLLACVVFYANLVVAWESITAYVDLIWTFYSFGSIYLLLLFVKEKKKSLLYLSGVFVGLAISVKLVAFLSLLLLLLAALYLKIRMNSVYQLRPRDFLILIVTSFAIPAPWFLFSYIHTGNPVYPFLSPIYPSAFSVLSLRNMIDTLSVFFFSPDPISPIYILITPLVVLYRNQFSKEGKFIAILSFFTLLMWVFTPKSGGSRFLLPWLPILSIMAVLVTNEARKSTRLHQLLVSTVIIIMLISIGYRGVANSKYIPVIFLNESKAHFLASNLNFSYGDFYDVDGFFVGNIQDDDVVLLIGFHNLYYVDFPYVDQSFVRNGDRFRYIAVQNTVLPERFTPAKRVYQNKLTGVSLYENGGKEWIY